ncbi:AfsR/SARP family transcriptional regulator [Streptomyces alfalfae]|uniref:Winged helix-turn-helix domain-containing protein n=1 Tax=Streptomyces alfalfae TaxID=1642299 RepID=A0A7T4PFE4_9ACTN|nr:BTAD domain-containing putative transcriptional regulator [Streptomyces alfalfae]QQC88993.1 winged helix-turn-helix domain-containing protein [Streptomyces alfalfae]
MRYRLLGSTQALGPDGSPVAVGGPRLRALLTVLALRAGRAVPVAALVDEVWAAEPPADAPGALQALVGRLRRALGAGVIASVDGGYRLSADPDDVDVFRFERLVGEGAGALADGDATKAAALLDDALALWGGEPLADLPDRTAEAARWKARRLDALRTRTAAALALGRAEQVLPELGALCDTHPLDEPLQALRLRALRDAGRAAEALAAYDGVRRLLADRLGTDPGPELRALHEELLRGPGPPPDRAPEPPGTGRDPRRPGTTRGPRRPGNLRARLTSFVGREADIDALRGDLARARLVTLLGPGGAGKTRLSQEAAEVVAENLPDGVWLAELAPVEDPADVPETLLTALGARETVLRGAGAEEMRALSERHGEDPVVRLVEHCAGRRMLIILDNCEHVVESAARLADELLARCPDLRILATSREPLGVPGESLRPVEPLPEPVALRLLAERGAAASPGFTVDDDPEAAAEICRRLDGLPLAIELAAARLRLLTPRQIADRLDDRFRLLTSGARTVLPRQQTLRAVVDWSWGLLDAAERTVLRRLSVFAGGCDLPAAEAVCATADGAYDVADVLGSLVDRSLVVAAPSPLSDAGMRYRLLETVAEYAGERLDEAGDRTGAERAHLTHYREVARTTDPELRGHGQHAAVERLETEYENVRTALRHAVAAEDEQEALCLVLSLSWYWQIRGLRMETRNWSRDVTALGPDPFAPPHVPAPPLYEPCTAAPPPMLPEVLREARRGAHLLRLSCMDLDMDDWQTPEAEEKLRGIRTVYRPGLPQTCRTPGNLWFFAVLLGGDPDLLRVTLDETVAACRVLGYRWELAAALQTRANLLANRGDWAGDARRDADEALRGFEELGDMWGIAEALSARGESHEQRGEFALAAADFEAAAEYSARIGAQAQVAVLKARLGSALMETEDFARGEAMLREILDNSGRTITGEALPAARLFLISGLGRARRIAEAREQLALLRDEFSLIGYGVFDSFVLGIESWIATLDGRPAQGLAMAAEALAGSRESLARIIAPQGAAVHLWIAAFAMASLDDGARAEDAARLLAAAARELPPGHSSNATERDIRGSAERLARAALGTARYEAAYAEGAGLSVEDAVVLCTGP